MNETKILVFDMDGTIADFYSIDSWSLDIKNHNTRPYRIAPPMYNMEELADLLNILKQFGYRVVVTTWLSVTVNEILNSLIKENYGQATAKEKVDWLAKYNFPADEVHCVPYGTPKSTITQHYGGYQILFDDNQKVREEWKLGETVDANKNILPYLMKLINKELN